MSLTADTIDRLKAQLLTSNLSQRNHTLYQVINQLIDALREGLNEIEGQVTAITSAPPSSGGGTTIISGMPLSTISDDNQETDWNWGPQGLKGDTGAAGASGSAGVAGPPGMDGEDGECDCMPFVGTDLYP